MCGSNIKSLSFFYITIRSWKRRLGDLRHNSGSAESCCLPTLTRFTGTVCTGPNRHIQKRMCTYGTQLIKQCTRKHNFAFNVRKVAMIVFMTTLSNLLKFQVILGGVRERPNRHAWKACVGKPTVGSNPTSSA